MDFGSDKAVLVLHGIATWDGTGEEVVAYQVDHISGASPAAAG